MEIVETQITPKSESLKAFLFMVYEVDNLSNHTN